MKTFTIKVPQESNYTRVTELLQKLASEQTIEYHETTSDLKEAEPATENQVQEIIDEAELGPYYSEEEAKQILHL